MQGCDCIKGENMYKLRRADYYGNFHGFTLKEGYYYGEDTETGNYIATSGWETYGNVALYFLQNEKWIKRWIDVEADFQIKNIPEIFTGNKMSFLEWLEEIQGITPEDWDENYSATMARQIEEEYESYLYDELPQFVIKNLQK